MTTPVTSSHEVMNFGVTIDIVKLIDLVKTVATSAKEVIVCFRRR